MKISTIRFILAAVSLFPAVLLCAMSGLMALLSLLTKGDLSAIPFGFPFITSLAIYVIFLVDTLKMYRDGK